MNVSEYLKKQLGVESDFEDAFLEPACTFNLDRVSSEEDEKQ